MPIAIEEYPATGRPFAIEELVDGGRPLVIRGLATHWPLVKLARQSNNAFAKRLAELDNGAPVDVLLMQPEEGGVVGYNANMDGFNYTHHRVSIAQGLTRLAQYSREHSGMGLAIQSASIASCLPAFTQDHSLPMLGPGIEPRLWIGNRVTTPVHFDEQHNIACVACGRRRFTLFPPEQIGNLYIGPLDFAPTGAAISLARLDQLDDPRFPRLKLAMDHARVAELEPGDAIYMPPLWWHHVESLERLNALVNYWWKPMIGEGVAANTALGCVYHCILQFKSLPAAERAAWKHMLDHYVFNDEDPAVHIPAARRGILGPLTAEVVDKLKQAIKRHL
jgi:hypothetical protein